MNAAGLYGVYAALAAGAAGLYIVLTSPGASLRMLRDAGAIVAAAGLAGVLVHLARWMGGELDGRVFFIIFAAIAIAAAARVITHPRPVYSALYFVLVVLAVTGLCILGAADFLGVALVIVYAGAILVTYVFVIMLAQQAGAAHYDTRAFQPLSAVALGFLLSAAAAQAMVGRTALFAHASGAGAVLPATVRDGTAPGAGGAGAPSSARVARVDYEQMNGKQGNVRAVGQTLLTTYVVALEVAGVLLLVAMVGAIAIAQKRIEPAELTPEEQAEAREEIDLHRVGREAAPF